MSPIHQAQVRRQSVGLAEAELVAIGVVERGPPTRRDLGRLLREPDSSSLEGSSRRMDIVTEEHQAGRHPDSIFKPRRGEQSEHGLGSGRGYLNPTGRILGRTHRHILSQLESELIHKEADGTLGLSATQTS